MERIIYFLSLVVLLTFIGCKGSDVYQGEWKALDMNGNKWDMSFSPNKFTIKNNKGITETYEYKQVSIKIENSIRSYGIKLKDGRAFIITFPIPGNTEKGIINHESTSEALYTIGRNEYVNFTDLLKF